MSSSPTDTADDAPADDAAFDALNSYLDALHAGTAPDRAALLARHPELAAALECLDAIDSLAPAPTEDLAGQLHSDTDATTLQLPPSALGASAPREIVPQGRDFGDYELLCELGRGGMGVVYKARQRSLDRVVAVKMILASHLASAEQIDRFYAEARAAARVEHPHIVGIHAVGELHGQHFFVMEHVEGQSLASRLAAGPMEPAAAAECVATIARAVHHLHGTGIVHRDLKPSNILIDGAGAPHVTDFGLAKVLMSDSRLTQASAIVGTPSYMAPEQAAARSAEVGPRSDVYSLGAMFYEMLVGRPPFREVTPLDTLVQVLEAEPRLPRELNPRVPRDLEMICLRCLEKAPDARYASAQELADDLDRFARGESVEARPPGVWQRVRRWSRREPALSSHLGMLVVCAAILQAHYTFTGHRDETPNHYAVMVVLALWAGISAVCQRLLRHEPFAESVRYVWAAADVALLTLVLVVTGGVEGPVAAVYPGLVAASGLWFREQLVRFMTALAVASYIGLLAFHHARGLELHEPLFRHVILLVVLVVLGFVVRYQVKRIRSLSRYYESRRLP
jgi:serine/threonine-protein kinase